MVEGRRFSVSVLMLVVAVILFVLAAFGVDEKLGIAFVPLGLAFFAGSSIV